MCLYENTIHTCFHKMIIFHDSKVIADSMHVSPVVDPSSAVARPFLVLVSAEDRSCTSCIRCLFDLSYLCSAVSAAWHALSHSLLDLSFPTVDKVVAQEQVEKIPG